MDTSVIESASQPMETIPGDDRRRAARVAVDLLVQYRAPTWDSFLETYALNVSTTGIFIVTPAPRPVGDELVVQFLDDAGDEFFSALARVVRVNPPGSASPGMGLEFLAMDGDSREVVDAIVRRKFEPR